MPGDPHLLSVSTAARLAGVSDSTLRNAISDGLVPCVWGAPLRVKLEHVRRWDSERSPPSYLSMAVAARKCGRSWSALERAVREGALPSYRDLRDRTVLYWPDVRAWARNRPPTGEGRDFRPVLLSLDQAAARLRTTPLALTRAANRGKFPVNRVEGQLWIREDDLERVRRELARKPEGRPRGDYLSLEEGARLLGEPSHRPLLRAIRRGQLRARSTTRGGHRRTWIERQELLAWAGRRPVPLAEDELTTHQAARLVGLRTPSLINYYIAHGHLPARWGVGPQGQQLWVKRGDLLRWWANKDQVGPGPGYVTVDQARELLGYASRNAVTHWIRRGRLTVVPWRKVPGGEESHWLSVEEVMALKQPPPPRPKPPEPREPWSSPGPEYVSTDQARELLGYASRNSIAYWIRRGRLAALRWMGDTLWVRYDEVLALGEALGRVAPERR